MDNSQTDQKVRVASVYLTTSPQLSGFGSKLLVDVDPNPDNFVCAGIVHTQAQQIGALIRLEPNKQAKMYRLTARSSKDSVAKIIVDLLVDQF